MLARYAPALIELLNLSFALLSDPGNKVAESFGAVFELPEDLKKIYRKVGIDLERYNGDARAHPDYATRPEPEETVALLRKMAGGED